MDKKSSQRIRTAVILAGGMGTRLLPITRVIPKEMLPLGPKPILHYIVDELKGAGIEEIIIVSRKGKTAIADYFNDNPNVRVIEKERALGPGHSVLIAREYLGDEGFLVAFGDSPIAGANPEEFLKKMMDVYFSQNPAALVAVQKVPRSETHLRGMIETAGSLEGGGPALVTALVQKPKPSESAGEWGAAGRYIYSSDIFDALHLAAARATEEILLADALKYMLAECRRVIALPVSEGLRRVDTGTFEGYFDAFQTFLGRNRRNH